MKTLRSLRAKGHPKSIRSQDDAGERITVSIVDSDELVRQGLWYMLETEEGFEVVGEFSNAEEALSQMAQLSPDIILMGLEMKGTDGIEATRRLKANGLGFDTDVIMIAECTDHLVQALEAGASGYLLKGVTGHELTGAIRQVYQNRRLSEEQEVCVEEVDLHISLPADAVQTSQFTSQMERALHARVLQTVGHRDWGIVVTVLLRPTSLSNLLNKLGNMSGVEKVGEEILTGGRFSGIIDRFRALSRSKTNLRKRILVAMRQTSMAGQGLAVSCGTAP